jgi:hypothetical protein
MTPALGPRVELATPPTAVDPELHDADKGEHHRYHRILDLLGLDVGPPRLAQHLLLTTAEEPSGIAEAQQDASWCRAMEEEMNSIE